MFISVIVPVYKVERWLNRCVESILSQTFRDFELILVDDGSPDRCGEMCDAFAQKDKRVRVIHQENKGVAAARNAGLDLAVGDSDSEYVAFADSDDWMEANCLEELVKGLEFGVEVVCLDAASVFSDGVKHSCYPDEGWAVLSPDEFWAAGMIGYVRAPWGKLYRKSLFKDVRYPVGKYIEDIFTTHLVLFQVDKLAVRALPVYNYFQGSESLTRSMWTPRKLDVVEGLEGACRFFHERGYSRAERSSKLRMWSVMAGFLAHLEIYDPEKAKEFRAKLQNAIDRGEIPFWEGRGIYRQMESRFYVVRWVWGMLCNAVTQGRRSWLVRESPQIAKMVVQRKLRLVGSLIK